MDVVWSLAYGIRKIGAKQATFEPQQGRCLKLKGSSDSKKEHWRDMGSSYLEYCTPDLNRFSLLCSIVKTNYFSYRFFDILVRDAHA